MKNYITILFFFIVYGSQAQTPHSISTRNMTWGTAFVNYKINPAFSASLDAQFRLENDGDIFQWLLRPGFTYKGNKGYLYTVGIAHFRLYPNPNGLPARPEWRPWIEFGRRWEFSGKKHSLYPRIRLEQRFIREYEGSALSDELSFHSWRIRLRFDYAYQFGKEGNQKWAAIFGDEVMFHQRANGFSSYDQNRLWLGAGYKFSDAFTLQATYVNLYQQRNSTTFDLLHIARLSAQITITGRNAKPAVK